MHFRNALLLNKYDDSVNIKRRRKPQTQDDTKRNSEMQLRSLKAWEDNKEGKAEAAMQECLTTGSSSMRRIVAMTTERNSLHLKDVRQKCNEHRRKMKKVLKSFNEQMSE